MNTKESKFHIAGMMCESCERKIENKLKKCKGIEAVIANYKESSLIVKYNTKLFSENDLDLKLNEIGYSLAKGNSRERKIKDILSILGIVIIALVILNFNNYSSSFDISQSLNSKVNFAMLFVIGMLSSLHCVGMCGGIMMSQSITISKSTKLSKIKPSMQYNLGRLISYTILGGIVGGIGQVVSISLSGQAFIAFASGLFMIIMGLNMWGIQIFRKFTIKLPWVKCCKKNRNRTPFIVGLLNGFMPCGPLQTMQLYALGTGSIFEGAASMFMFALGTIPLMLGFGILSNLLSQNNSQKLMKVSALIIIILGISMASRGIALSGFKMPAIYENNNVTQSDGMNNQAEIVGDKQIVTISANNRGYTPRVVYIQKNFPTEFIIEGDSINSCNNEIIIPSLNIKKKLSSGSNNILFVSQNEDIKYSCWMGMKRGTLKVVDDLNAIDDKEIQSTEYENEESKFYGVPLSKVSTNKLIKIAKINREQQEIEIKNIELDFEPAVIVINSEMETKIRFDLNEKELDGEYKIYNEDFSKEIKSFNVIDGKANVILPKLQQGAYGISKDNQLYSILEVRLDTNNVNKEFLRMKYFSESSGAACH